MYAIKHMPFLIAKCHPGSEGIHSFLILRHRTDIPVPSSERSIGERPLTYLTIRAGEGGICITQTYCCMYIHKRKCAVIYLRDVRFRNAAASHRDSHTEIKA